MNINDLNCDENEDRIAKINTKLGLLKLASRYVSGNDRESILSKIDALEEEKSNILNPKKTIVRMKAEDLDDDLIDNTCNRASIDDIEVCDGKEEVRSITDQYISKLQKIIYDNIPEKIVRVGVPMELIIQYLTMYDKVKDFLHKIVCSDSAFSGEALNILTYISNYTNKKPEGN